MKKCVWFIVFYFFILRLSSQVSAWLTAEPYGSYVTCPNQLVAGDDGEISVAAEKFPNGGIYLARYDKNGNKIWDKHYPGYHSIVNLSTDVAGDIYLTISLASNLIINNTQYDVHNGSALFIKYDSNGRIIWVSQPHYGTRLPKYFDRNNQANICGAFVDSVTFKGGIFLQKSGGGTCHFVGKIDTSGKFSVAIPDEAFTYILGNASSSFFVHGEIIYPASITLGKGSNQVTLDKSNGPQYCAKYTSSGELIWAKQIRSSLIAPDEQGNMYAMEYDSSFSKTCLITKYSPTGNLLWKRTSIYLDQSYKCQMTCDRNGDLFLSGGFFNYMTIGDTTIYTNNLYHTFVAKLDSSGAVKWIITNEGSGWCGAKDITVKGNEVYVTGDMGGTITFGNTTISQPNGGIYTLKIADGNVSGHVQEIKNNTSFQVYPNPSGTVFTIEYESKTTTNSFSLKVEDVNGRTVYRENISSSNSKIKKEINLKHLARGTYFLSLHPDGSQETFAVKKIVLE